MAGDASFDGGGYSAPGEGGDGGASTAQSSAAYAESQKMAKAQLDLLQKIVDAVDESATSTADALQKMGTEVAGLKGSIVDVRGAVLENVGATRGVEGAVRESNANGVLYAIMGRISALGA